MYILSIIKISFDVFFGCEKVSATRQKQSCEHPAWGERLPLKEMKEI